MERLKRGSSFWVALLATVLVPATVLASKQLYHTNLKNASGAGVGSAVVQISNSTKPDYLARTHSLGGFVVTQVWLAPTDNAWQIPLCTGGGAPEDDCTYSSDGTGNLDIEGTVSPALLMSSGVSGKQFMDALRGGTLGIVLADGSGAQLASGVFVRIM